MFFFENTHKPEGFGGMTIYNSAQILGALNQAGFRDAKAEKMTKAGFA